MFENGAKIKFKKNLELIEELEPSEVVHYSLKIDKEKGQKILF